MRIACVLESEFEDSEFRVPYDRLQQAGHEVIVVGLEAGTLLTGHKGRQQVTTDAGIDAVEARDFDALFVPGGFSPDKLRADERVLEFVRGFAEKPILAICHGPQLLISADLHLGRHLTAWKTIQGDLRRMDADVVDEEVVVDRNLVTSRHPGDLDAFCAASLRMLEGVEARPSIGP